MSGDESGGSGCHADTIKSAFGLIVFAILLALGDGNFPDLSAHGGDFFDHLLQGGFHALDFRGQLVERIDGFIVRGEGLRGSRHGSGDGGFVHGDVLLDGIGDCVLGIGFLLVRWNLFGDGFRGFGDGLRFDLFGFDFGFFVRLSRNGLFRFLLSLSLRLLCDDRHGDVFARASSADDRTVSVVKFDLPVACIQQTLEKLFPDAEIQITPPSEFQVVNALSSKFEITSWREGKCRTALFHEGVLINDKYIDPTPRACVFQAEKENAHTCIIARVNIVG